MFKGNYNKLGDKSVDIRDRLKLSQKLWDSNYVTSIFNKNQLIIDWIVNLIINKK